MADIDKVQQYGMAERLYAEQNFVNGTVAAIIAAIVGALAWGAISVMTGYMIGYVAIGVGVLVGYGMQMFGKGLDAKYSAVAAVLAILGCLLGNLAAGVFFEVQTYNLSVGEVLSGLTLDAIVAFYAETLEFMDLVFWILAVGAAWQFAPRKLTEEEALAVYAYENQSMPTAN